MTEQEILELFQQSRALLEGHFQLSSGLHSSGYLQCALVLQHPARASRIGAALAEKLGSLAPGVQTVVAPALGGILVAHEVARALNVRGIFAERREGRLMLRRGFTIEPGEACVVVEDVLTTGKSTLETMEVVQHHGGRVLAAGSIVDRGAGKVELKLPFASLLPLSLPTQAPEDCPLCREGIPTTKPGSR